MRDLAVAVVDEQHRFGVEQRRALTEGRSPHVLHMTATPIPRTLALTVYGDLAVSEIAKPPAMRKPVITSWIPEEKAPEAYRRLQRLLDDGRQAYVVCPLVEASETTQARAAEQEAERLRRAELKGYRIGCLHGRLKPADRRELMSQFKSRDLDVLVMPTAIGTAPTFEGYDPDALLKAPSFMAIWNLTGQPAASICCGFSEAGLPIGMQIVGKAYDDAMVLRVGDAYQRVSEWHVRTPHLGATA